MGMGMGNGMEWEWEWLLSFYLLDLLCWWLGLYCIRFVRSCRPSRNAQQLLNRAAQAQNTTPLYTTTDGQGQEECDGEEEVHFLILYCCDWCWLLYYWPRDSGLLKLGWELRNCKFQAGESGVGESWIGFGLSREDEVEGRLRRDVYLIKSITHLFVPRNTWFAGL
jgi:hypothetical protein